MGKVMNVSEETFEFWAQGPGATETEKCENAETAIRKAIAADAELSKMDISVFAQGSYRARTNVRQDSDVDICVCCNSTFFADYPSGKAHSDFGNSSSDLSFTEFKNKVQSALEAYFGEGAVNRGKKAFDVHPNTYRIDADVVPAFEHRRYTGNFNANGTHECLFGIAFRSDDGDLIKNWPEQNYNNGVAKNDATSRHYKRVIRILKRLRYEMQDEGILAAKDISSFLIECLVFNAPNEAFQHDTYTEDVRYVIADLWNRTRKDEDCSGWGEVNELKYLFRPSQPWNRQQVNQFLQAAWDYIGFA